MKSFSSPAFFDQACKDDLPTHVLQFQSYVTFLQYEPVYEKTLEHLKNTRSALDWGCGNGHFSYFLLQRNIDVTGYSFDRPPPYLVGRKGYKFVAGNRSEPTDIPFGSQSFDYVFSIGVLEHVAEMGGNEQKSILEIVRLLKPGGLFLCFHLPNQHQWVEPLIKKLRINEYTHARRYTESEIRELVSHSGMTLESIGLYNFLPRNPFNRLPASIRNSKMLGIFIGFLDKILSHLLARFCVNYYFIARKDSTTAKEFSEKITAPACESVALN